MSDPGKTPILFVHHRPERGGAPESLGYLLRELDRSRFEPHVFCPEGEAAAFFGNLGAHVHTGPVAGFTHIWASWYHGLRWLLLGREIARLPRHVRAFRQTLASTPFALVHLNDSPPVVAAWLAHRRGVPVVWHLRSALAHDGRDLRSRGIRAAIRRFAAAAVAINADVAASFDVGADVVPNPVDLDRFHPGREELDPPAAGPVVTFVGFVYPPKGYRQLLEAAALLRYRGLEATYVFAGGGVRDRAFFRSLRGRLLVWLGLTRDHLADARRLVRSLGLDDAVRLLPYVDDPAPLYRASDVVAAPSQGPELGRSVLEAAASGVPVVVSGSPDGGGIVVPGRTGLLARDGSAAAIADALEELLRDPAARGAMAAAARSHAQASFGAGRAARAVEDVYAGILGRAAGAAPVVERLAPEPSLKGR